MWHLCFLHVSGNCVFSFWKSTLIGIHLARDRERRGLRIDKLMSRETIKKCQLSKMVVSSIFLKPRCLALPIRWSLQNVCPQWYRNRNNLQYWVANPMFVCNVCVCVCTYTCGSHMCAYTYSCACVCAHTYTCGTCMMRKHSVFPGVSCPQVVLRVNSYFNITLRPSLQIH